MAGRKAADAAPADLPCSMHGVGLAVEHVLELCQPGLGQRADLGIVAQDALHDAGLLLALIGRQRLVMRLEPQLLDQHGTGALVARHPLPIRSEEHTSELQSPCNLVCRLLLEKKNIGNISAMTVSIQLHSCMRVD